MLAGSRVVCVSGGGCACGVFRRARRAAECRRLHSSPRRPQVKCHQTAFRNIWNDLYGAKESVWGAGRGAARPWDSGARASRTPPPPRAPPATSRIPARLPSNLFSRDPRSSTNTLATPGLHDSDCPWTLAPFDKTTLDAQLVNRVGTPLTR